MKDVPQVAQISKGPRFALLAVAGVFLVYAISDHPLYGGSPGFGKVQFALIGLGALLFVAAWLPIAAVKNTLLLVCTALLGLGVAEWLGNALLGSALRPVFKEDTTLIFRMAPGRTGVFTHLPENGGATITYKVNSDGYRGPELLPAGAARRVVVYGDSFIHAFYTPEQETFTSKLGEDLRARLNEEVEVINAGVGAYGPDQILHRLSDELGKLNPDVVIVAVFAGNDFGDLMRNKMFRLDGDGSLVANSWQLDPGISGQFLASEHESILIRAMRSILVKRKSTRAVDQVVHPHVDSTGRLNLDFLIAEAQREFKSHVIDRNPIVTNINIDYYSADVALQPRSESAKYKVQLMGAVLEEIAKRVQNQGVPVFFLFVPHPGDLAENNDWMRVDREIFPEYDGRNQIAPLEAFADRIDAPFLSLYDPFREVGPDPLYLKGGDDHWNSQGQALAAQLTGARLVEAGLIRTSR